MNKNILILIETAVTISKLAYLPEKDRCARHILQFYNATWLHHELCRKLFLQFHAGMTRKRFFGSYLHALVVHAPVQFELISLRSINTENQERFFGQARKSATAASNRQPQNVVSTTVLRLQAKLDLHGVSTSVQQAESKVAKASKNVSQFEGTHITEAFISPRTKSWQQHLRRISPYLHCGEGIWWKRTSCGYQYDGDCDDGTHSEGP